MAMSLRSDLAAGADVRHVAFEAATRYLGLPAQDARALVAQLLGDRGRPSSRRPAGGRPARPAGRHPQRHRQRYSAPVALRAATDRPVRGQRLDFDRMDAPDGPVPLLWRHRGAPIGTVDAIELDTRTLTATVRFDLHTVDGARCWREHERGRPLHASVGYLAGDADERGWVRSWSLLDVSVVPPGKGADPGAVSPSWMLPARVSARV